MNRLRRRYEGWLFMLVNVKKYVSLLIWVASLIGIGWLIGFLTKPEGGSWYSTLNRSAFTPPNYVFPIAWTILYGLIGASGWLIWQIKPSREIDKIKTLYVVQLLLNWAWSPVFFSYQSPDWALIILIAMVLAVGSLISSTYRKVGWAAGLLIPYFHWIIFATYLNI